MKNKKLDKIDEIRGIMLSLEMNLSLLEQDLDSVDKELTYLKQVKEDLLYNIKLHKSGSVITIAREYKRSIDELKMVRDEIVKYKNHRNILKKKMDDKLNAYDYYLNEYERAFDELNSESVILLFRKENDEKK